MEGLWPWVLLPLGGLLLVGLGWLANALVGRRSVRAAEEEGRRILARARRRTDELLADSRRAFESEREETLQADREARARPRTLPITCTTSSNSSSTRCFGSALGHGA